jgi:hypothetical protein
LVVRDRIHLAAVAARNAQETAAQGAQLMEASASLSRDERTYLTSALASAYVRLGEMRQAGDLLTRQWSEINHDGEFALSPNELRALARGRDNPALAHTRAKDSGADGS